jgi:hypothetical protein
MTIKSLGGVRGSGARWSRKKRSGSYARLSAPDGIVYSSMKLGSLNETHRAKLIGSAHIGPLSLRCRGTADRLSRFLGLA